MSTPVEWPALAPQFAESWQQQNKPVTIRSEMEVGPPKVRRRYTNPIREFGVQMIGTHAQGMEVQEFFEITTQGGVLWHNFRHPFTNVVEQFRFVEAPSIQNLGALGTTISMKWEQFNHA